MTEHRATSASRPLPVHRSRGVRIQPPVSVAVEYTQALDATPDEAFELLCPVREAEWVPGWRPSTVLSESGLVERDCVFVTPDAEATGGEPREATWVVTEHDAGARRVEMLKLSPGYLVTRLRIDVARAGAGSTAHVRYRYTALGPDGEAFVRDWTAERWSEFMQSWETNLNEFLRHARSRRLG